MAAEVIGTPQTISMGQSATPGAQSVSVPSDAQFAAVFFGMWYDSGVAALDSLGSDFAGTWSITQANTTTSCGVAIAEVTATGSRTITPAWATSLSQGPAFIVAFLRGIDAADPVRDTDAVSASGSVDLTIDSAADDLVLCLDAYAGSSAPDNETGWTSLQTQVLTDTIAIGARLRAADSPGASSTTATTQNSNFPRLAMASFRAGEVAPPAGRRRVISIN